MKKNFWLLTVLIFMFMVPKAYSIDIQTVLNNIGFNVLSKKDAAEEITKVIDKQQNYTNKKNYEKLKKLYTNTYANFDGINIDDYIESIKKTADIYRDLKYKTVINSVNINGEYATVEAVDTADGITRNEYETVKGKGILHSESKSIYYFKKEDGIWKIDAEASISEKSFLKYGSAKEIEFKLDAPECIKADTEYNIKISAEIPSNKGLMASITTEPIQFPHIKSEDIFRVMKKDGELERMVMSNNEGKNEVAIASVAIAKPVLNQESKIDFVVDGVAFISSRVNVIPAKKGQKNE